jgi:hypothetical protein
MKRMLFTAIAATMLFASCEPNGVELSKPEEPKKEVPGNAGKVEPNESNNFNDNKYWLLYKTGKYELYNRDLKTTGQYLIDEAERLLRTPGTKWEIPAGAPYLFSQDNGLKFEKKMIK